MASGGMSGGYPSSGVPLGPTAQSSLDASGDHGVDDSRETPAETRMSVHEANRVKKSVEQNVVAIENRIRYFQREEEKIWKDLEEVRRQAAMIEEGRTRTVEKKVADQTIAQAREARLQANRLRAAKTRQEVMEQRRQHQFVQTQAKQLAGQEQRRQSAEILRQKRMKEAQEKLSNSEKAVAVQRNQLEARLRVNQERAERLEKLRAEQEAERLTAEQDVHVASSRLPDLEAAEMMCLQRLQNSRIVTQNVLQELESSLGSGSAISSMLRNRPKQQQDSPGNLSHGIPEDPAGC
eukprot:TRINITY_DN63337_c0_g1_i1.p1 TRINITY_DN63337_c0_g1~~TRINITY_DN63337_c0_g1_i1.p1  ORF type:complete len:294 (+),score=68.51 TRINITY_DN63337_c0_g1_i1:106-987(+)